MFLRSVFCGPRTHNSDMAERRVAGLLLGKAAYSLAGSPEGSSRFVAVCCRCTNPLMVKVDD